MPHLIESIAAVRERVDQLRRSGTIGLVPTMGALHAGHRRLIERARADCDGVVVTIFVNPLQFDREEDLGRYPRTLEADVEVCRSLNVQIVFAPSAAEMYPEQPLCTIEVSRIADHLCGRFRPGHFQGVATVVMKLFQIVGADRAYFGEKDAQQLAIVRRLARDFNIPVTIVAVSTVREADGLAVSSRNQLLDPTERKKAPALYQALSEARRLIEAGVVDSSGVARAASAKIPSDSTLRLEYLEIVDPDDMQPLTVVHGRVCVAGALWVGSTRLIDNVMAAPG